MISIVVGLITLAAAVTVYILVFKGTVLNIRSTQLNYDIDNLMLLMTNDIRRAGYWGGAVLGEDDVTGNPFMQADTDITINTDWDGKGNHCVVYSYDLDGDGQFDSDSDGLADGDDTRELVGFRLNDDETISMRLEGTDPDSCLDSGGTWQVLTVTANNEQVRITDFDISFSSLPADTTNGDGAGPYQAQTADSLCDNINDSVSAADASVDCLGYTPAPVSGALLAIRRIVNIRITAESGSDSEVVKSLTASVKLGNDALKLAP